MAQIVAAVEARLADPVVLFDIGRKNRNRNSRPPRVCFLPQKGPIEPTDHVGGTNNVATGRAARQRYKRELAVRVECWGRDLDQAEQLYENVLVTMRAELGTSFQPSEEEWLHELEENADDVINGAVIAFDCAIHFPVFDGVVPLVHATMSHEGNFEPNTAAVSYGSAGVRYGDTGLVYSPSEAVC